MKTNTSSSDKRRLALVTIYASLSSVFAMQLAVQYTGASTALQGFVTRVAALPGTHGIGRDDLRSYQRPSAYKRVRVHAAPTIRRHQDRTR